MTTLKELSERISEIVVEMYNDVATVFATIGEEALDEKLDWEEQVKNKVDITKVLDLRETLVDDDLVEAETFQYAFSLELTLTDIRSILLTVTKRTPATINESAKRAEVLAFFPKLNKCIEELSEIADVAHESFFEWLNHGWEVTKNTSDIERASELWNSYTLGQSDMTIKQFAKALRFVGATPYVGKENGKSVRVYRGIRRKP